MKILKPEVKISQQGPGVSGLYEHLEKVGRVAYKSEDKIAPGSAEKFVGMIKSRGHWAVLDLGTAYMTIPGIEKDLITTLQGSPWVKFGYGPSEVYVTTPYRVIHRLGLEEEMKKYWTEPDERFHLRVTTWWRTNRGISHELVRHASLRPVQESTRYINYSSGRWGSELTFIEPDWFKDESKAALIDARTRYWQAAEDQYFAEIKAGLQPQEARGILPHDIKTELYLTGYLRAYTEEPDPASTTEKYGFLYLRRAKDAHPDVRALSESLYRQFKAHDYV